MLVGMYAFVLSFAIRDATRPAYDPALALAIQAMLAGGAGAVASWLMERAQEQWPKVKALRADVKSYLAMAIAGGIGCLLFLLQVVAQYHTPPVDAMGWVEGLFASAAACIIVNKATHSIMVLRGKR